MGVLFILISHIYFIRLDHWTFPRTFNDSSSVLSILLQHSSIGGGGGGWGWGEVVVLRASLVTSMLLRQCWSSANSMGKIKHNIEHSVFTFFYFETWTHNQQSITGVGEVQWGVGGGGGGRMVTEKLPQRIFDYIQNKTKQSKTSWLSHVTYMLFRLTWTLFFSSSFSAK